MHRGPHPRSSRPEDHAWRRERTPHRRSRNGRQPTELNRQEPSKSRLNPSRSQRPSFGHQERPRDQPDTGASTLRVPLQLSDTIRTRLRQPARPPSTEPPIASGENGCVDSAQSRRLSVLPTHRRLKAPPRHHRHHGLKPASHRPLHRRPAGCEFGCERAATDASAASIPFSWACFCPGRAPVPRFVVDLGFSQ